MNDIIYVPVNKTYAPAKAKRFVEDIIKVCKRYGYSLSYEGTPFSGDFVIEPYSTSAMEHLREASVFLPKEVTNE